MAYMIYGNSGGIHQVQAMIKSGTPVYSTLKEALEAAQDNVLHTYDVSDLSIKYYGYDDRIDKDVYVILTRRCSNRDFIKMYGTPQFASYLIEV